MSVHWVVGSVLPFINSGIVLGLGSISTTEADVWLLVALILLAGSGVIGGDRAVGAFALRIGVVVEVEVPIPVVVLFLGGTREVGSDIPLGPLSRAGGGTVIARLPCSVGSVLIFRGIILPLVKLERLVEWELFIVFWLSSIISGVSWLESEVGAVTLAGIGVVLVFLRPRPVHRLVAVVSLRSLSLV